ncbi:DUF4214 domain-containing protein, partial [Sulfurimonas sp.]|uniref:Ig-like domain-containing protein n=1 Tax=Sulfurimonas sp. TaxID=2022749 RepID=UPI0025CBC19A
MQENRLLLAELYTAYFNRAPDAAGLAYWESELDNGVLNFSQITSNWANEQQEFTDIYGENIDSDALITQVYANVLGRTPDTDGAAYWNAELSNGNIPMDQFIQAIVNGAKAASGSAGDASLLSNKAQVGVAMADAGINDLTFATQVVATVTSDTSTADIVKSIITMAAADTAGLANATATLDSVKAILVDAASAATLTTTLANLSTVMQNLAADVTAGTVTNIAATLTAATATIKAATQDASFVADPETLADSIATNPAAVEADADVVSGETTSPPASGGGGSTPADTTAPTATLTYSTDGGTSYSSTISTKDADTLIIKATFSEAIADATGATIAIDSPALAATAMTKVNTTVYTYSLNVPAGDIAVATVTIGAAKDAAGNVISAAPTNATFEVDNTAPTLSSSNPADGAVDMIVGNDIVLTFSEDVSAGTGNVTLYQADNTEIEQIAIGDAKITFGTNTVTINPTDNLLDVTGYYIKIDATAIVDAAGNAYAGIADATTLNFTTPVAPSSVATLGELQALITSNDGSTSVTMTGSIDTTGEDISQFTSITVDDSAVTAITATMTPAQIDALAGHITKGTADLVVAIVATGVDITAFTLTDANLIQLTSGQNYSMTAAQAAIAQIGAGGTPGTITDGGTMT